MTCRERENLIKNIPLMVASSEAYCHEHSKKYIALVMAYNGLMGTKKPISFNGLMKPVKGNKNTGKFQQLTVDELKECTEESERLVSAIRYIEDTEKHKAPRKSNDEIPDYLYELMDEDGNLTGEYGINYSKYSGYLSTKYHIVNFKKTLYIYDTANCLYLELQNEVNTHIRDTCIKYNVPGKLLSHTREIDCHIRSMGNEKDYPFNCSRDTIPVMNGIVKISYDTGKVDLLNHGPEHLFTYKLAVDYNQDTKPDTAINLLNQWVDEEYAPALLQIPAQALLQMQTGNAYKKAYLLQGEPHAGKTSYLTLLTRLFTPEFIASIRLQQVCEDRFTGGKLEGKLLNIYDDLEDVPLDTIDAFKTLTGSCSHDVERKYRDGYVGRVTAVHVFTCNYPPEYPEKVKRDSAFWARWEYLKFPNSYPVDPKFYERVFTDEMLSSFLNAVIGAMIQIRKNGLLISSDIQKVMESWSINSDPLYDFISWGFGSGDNKTTNKYSKGKLYAAYREFCNRNNIPEHKRKGTLTSFTLAIQPHGFIPMQHRERKVSYEVYATSAHKVNPENIKDLAIKDLAITGKDEKVS